jgi:hypothetical protein
MNCKCGNPVKVGHPLNCCWCCHQLETRGRILKVPNDEDRKKAERIYNDSKIR